MFGGGFLLLAMMLLLVAMGPVAEVRGQTTGSTTTTAGGGSTLSATVAATTSAASDGNADQDEDEDEPAGPAVRWNPMDLPCFGNGTQRVTCEACLATAGCTWCEWKPPPGVVGLSRSFCYLPSDPIYANRVICGLEEDDEQVRVQECPVPEVLPFFTPQVIVGVVLAGLIALELIITIPMECALRAENRRKKRLLRAAEQAAKKK